MKRPRARLPKFVRVGGRLKRRTVAGDPLTAREIEVMWHVADGLSNKKIADRLDISDHTAKFHIANSLQKLGTSSRAQGAVNFVLTLHAQAKARGLPRTIANASP